jgi:hypothetical protein
MLKWLKELFGKKPEPVEMQDGRKVKDAEFMTLPLGTRYRVLERDGVYRMDNFRMWDTNGLGDMAFSVEATELISGGFFVMTIARKMPQGINPRMFVPIRDIRVFSE